MGSCTPMVSSQHSISQVRHARVLLQSTMRVKLWGAYLDSVGREHGFVATPVPESGSNACPLGQGFWKNHPGAWPVSSLTLGSQTYVQAQLLTILTTPVRGDASLVLADQLIAAKLNIAHGSNP